MSALKRSGGIFDYDQRSERLIEVERELEQPSVWDDPERAQALGKERADLELIVKTIDNLTSGLEDAEGLLDIAAEEEDEGTVAEIESDLEGLDKELEKLEFRRMFSGEMDANNAYLDIQAGSGGTEAQDWANMLLRMYLRWAERRGFKAEIVELRYFGGLSLEEVALVQNTSSSTVKRNWRVARAWLLDSLNKDRQNDLGRV